MIVSSVSPRAACLRGVCAWLLLASAGLQLSACGSALRKPYPQKTIYALEIERPGTPSASGAVTSGTLEADEARGARAARVLRVTRVVTASLFERKGLVYRTGPDTYETDFYRELYAAPGVAFHDVLVRWLTRSRLPVRIVGGNEMDAADWLLECRIEAFYFDLRDRGAPKVRFAFEYSLRAAQTLRSPSASILEGRRSYAQPAASADPRDLVRALDAVLGTALAELETELRAYFAGDGSSAL